MKKQQIKAFTLIEIIVVITILAILATIGFMSYQSYTSDARDANRITSFGEIKNGLNIYKLKNRKFPSPDGSVLSGTINGTALVYVGEFGDTISKKLNLTFNPTDPLTKTNYIYGTTKDYKYYQISSIMENTIGYENNITNQTYAGNEEAKVEGNYKGILKYSSGSEKWITNVPSLIFNNTGSVDLLNSGTYFVVNKKTNLPYNFSGIKDSSIRKVDGTSLIRDITKSTNATLTGVNITNLTTDNFAIIFTGATLNSFNVSGVSTGTLAYSIKADIMGVAAADKPSCSNGAIWDSTNGCNPFILDTNGITVKCAGAELGSTGVINGKTYIAVGDGTGVNGIKNTGITDYTSLCTSNVTDISNVFQSKTTFNQDISSWDTSKVTTMSYMFYGASAFNQPIGTWNTANVTNMSYMFRSASAFNQNISTWDTSKVTNMSEMFNSASTFNQAIGTWNTSNVTNMSSMFYYASAFNQAIGTWNTSNVTNMSSMFRSASAFNQAIGTWNTANVTNMSSMFRSASTFNQNISSWDTSKVTNMSSMFAGAIAFNQPIGTWNTTNVTNMGAMFEGVTVFNQNLSSWNTANVTDISDMFRGTNFNHNISNWNLSKLTRSARIFQNNTSFNQDISNWKTTRTLAGLRNIDYARNAKNTAKSPLYNNYTTFKRIFSTVNKYNGNLGGLAGADIICNNEAGTYGVTGTYKAILSDSTTNASSRIGSYNGPYVNGNTIVINDSLQFLDTSKWGAGYFSNFIGVYNSSYYWSYTDINLNKRIGDNHCNNWTSNSSVLTGERAWIPNNIDRYLNQVGGSSYQSTCEKTEYFLCIEQ